MLLVYGCNGDWVLPSCAAWSSLHQSMLSVKQDVQTTQGSHNMHLCVHDVVSRAAH